MSEIKHYLEMTVGFRKAHMPAPPEEYDYVSFEEYVLRNGSVMESSALTEDEEAIVQASIDRAKKMGHDVTEMQQCFSNAQLLVICDDSDELVYHEGYAVGLSIVVHHGWVTINGKVVDSTWKLKEPASRSFLPEHPVGELPESYVYFGFAIENEDYIIHRIDHREIVGSLLDDWEGRYPLLRGIDPHDDESLGEFYDEIEQAEDKREETG
jgi:hypothetical protein